MKLENLSNKIAQLKTGDDSKFSILINGEHKYQFQVIRMIDQDWIIFGGYGIGLLRTYPIYSSLNPDEIAVDFVNAINRLDLKLSSAIFVSNLDFL